MKKIVGFQVDNDQVVGREGGFLGIRRLHLRNRRDDGSLSERYICDFIDRPMGIDAVVVAVWHRRGEGAGGGVQVLLRQGLRPALAFGRTAEAAPVPETRSYMFLTELVAGIIESHDRGHEGIRRRAAEEVLEEAGYQVDPEDVILLGAPMFPSPGAMAEKFWLAAVEIADPSAQMPLAGDGSPMEEGATTEWRDLDQAIAGCLRGEVEDCKTEIALRRLRDRLAGD